MSTQTKHKQQDLSGSTLVFQCTKCSLQFGKKKEALQHLCQVKNLCQRCGREGHYSSSCHSKRDNKGNEIESEDEGYTSDKYYY